MNRFRGALALLLALSAGALAWSVGGADPGRGELREGLKSLGAGDRRGAEAAFLAAVREGSPEIRRVAFHNLGLMRLETARDEEGEPARAAALEAVRYGESSLRLSSTASDDSGTARNLELALRRLQELEATEGAVSRSPPGGAGAGEDRHADAGQQLQPAPSDTEEEGVRSRAEPPREPSPQGPPMTRENALRLLASFQLLERQESAEVIRSELARSRVIRSGVNRSALAPGSAAASPARRGPPW